MQQIVVNNIFHINVSCEKFCKETGWRLRKWNEDVGFAETINFHNKKLYVNFWRIYESYCDIVRSETYGNNG